MLYLIVRFNFILRLSVALLHEGKDLWRSLRSPVFRFISGVLRVIHRGIRPGTGYDHVRRERGEHEFTGSGCHGPTETTTWMKALRPAFWSGRERVRRWISSAGLTGLPSLLRPFLSGT